jgi:hypothetical protein
LVGHFDLELGMVGKEVADHQDADGVGIIQPFQRAHHEDGDVFAIPFEAGANKFSGREPVVIEFHIVAGPASALI